MYSYWSIVIVHDKYTIFLGFIPTNIGFICGFAARKAILQIVKQPAELYKTLYKAFVWLFLPMYRYL
jgi:hypothetical protein